MLHHASLPVADLQASAALFDAALGALGYLRAFTAESAIGYGTEPGKDKLCLMQVPDASSAGRGFHLAFAAPTRQAVEQFHAAAIAKGARDNGAPGLRPHYGPDYFAAYVIDLDGHRLEAVCKPD